jgi:hypothetical protein
MSNFDTVDQTFQQSLNLLLQVVEILSVTQPSFKKYISMFTSLNSGYHQIITNILIENKESIGMDQSKLLLDFYNSVEQIGLPNTINDVIDSINNSSLTTLETQIIAPYLSKFNKLPKYENLEKPTEEILKCKNCGEMMAINQSTNEFECVCGIVKNLEGSCYEEVSYTDGQMPAVHKTNYVRAGHSFKCLMHLQARENFDFPDGKNGSRNVKGEILKQFLVESIYYVTQVNVDVMRKILKDLKLTEYNSHIPLLIKETTRTRDSPGKMPFQLTQKEFDTIIDDIVKILEILSEVDDGNSPYHPYLLLKVLEQRLPENTRILKNTAKPTLCCIFIYKQKTLSKKMTNYGKLSVNICMVIHTKLLTSININSGYDESIILCN